MNAVRARAILTMASLLSAVCAPGTLVAQEENLTAGDNAPFGEQQALFDRINLEEAWRTTKGNPNVLVGVIDNGFDFFHPDLKGQVVPGYYYSGGFHTEFYEAIAHGTMISSMIVAKDDDSGMVGLAPHCKVLTASQGMIEHTLLKTQREYVRDHPESTLAELQAEMRKHQSAHENFGRDWIRYQFSGAADAIRYLVDHGARVINFSGALEKSLCPFPDVWKNVEDAFAYAAEKDVVIVLSAGNNAARWEGYPGESDSVLVVGASLLDDTRWEQELDVMGAKIKQGSNYGDRLSVMAPVESLVTCQPHDPRWYSVNDGPMGPMKVEFGGTLVVRPNGATSCAAPIVSALVALVLSVRPNLDAETVIEIVTQGCDDIGEPGYDIQTGHGRVNFGKTIEIAVAWPNKS